MSVLDDWARFATERGVPMLGKPALDAEFCRDNHVGAAIAGWGGFMLGQSVAGRAGGYFGLGLGAVAGAAIEAWAKAVVKEIGSMFG